MLSSQVTYSIGRGLILNHESSQKNQIALVILNPNSCQIITKFVPTCTSTYRTRREHHNTMPNNHTSHPLLTTPPSPPCCHHGENNDKMRYQEQRLHYNPAGILAQTCKIPLLACFTLNDDMTERHIFTGTSNWRESTTTAPR